MTFNTNIRIQIASICFLIIIIVDYFRFKHTKQSSSKWFKMLLGFTCVYLVFDIATVYTVNYMISSTINRLAHQIFIGSLETIIFCMFMYVEVLGHTSRNSNETLKLLMSVPYFIALGFVFCGDLDYMVTDQGNYSYGPMADAVYVIALIYVIVIFINTFRYNDAICSKKRTALRLGIVIWLFFTLFQMIFPSILLSSLASGLQILVVYLSCENPNEKYDDTTDSFNEKAFFSVTAELLTLQKSFCIINIAVIDYTTINQNMGHTNALKLMSSINKYAGELFDSTCYHCAENCMSLIYKDMTPDEKKLEQLTDRLSQPFIIDQNSLSISASICVLPCPKYAEGVETGRSLEK